MDIADASKKRPARKHYRLAAFDYRQCGAYFVTVCTQDRQPFLWDDRATVRLLGGSHLLGDVTAFVPPLSVMGKAVSAAIAQIPSIYDDVAAEPFGIMPDHFHMILNIFPDENGLPQPAPSLSRVVQQLKRAISLRIGQSIWQKSYYEHIVRNELDYQEISKYIGENPIRWVIKRQAIRAQG